jgi:alkanesulfonate monooxygenase SsuD/methylene tetrahydromethanopterin reductase-like flavin-dependent oxidoreductase (luciferase family)
MKYDIFFSISQTPVDGPAPSEAQMFRNFLDQVQVADELGYGTAWIAESHLSSEVQKAHDAPVVPHWKGEVGLNCNFLNLATHIFHRTKRIEVGSAVMNIVCMGGPIAHAERIASFLALHGLNEAEQRRIHVGFSAGRFQFMNRASGIGPRNAVEKQAWPALRGLVFQEACEIFIRALKGETFSSADIAPTVLKRESFWTAEQWQAVADVHGGDPSEIHIPNRWEFDVLKIIPQDFRRDLLQLIIGSHAPHVQAQVNAMAPVQVFNLSITKAEIIESTHDRMKETYHPSGGEWKREYMPRTTFVFLNEEAGLSPEQRNQAADQEARKALSEYWKALQGTLDPKRLEQAANNALIGNAEQVAQQIRERFHPDDRLMLWFDFFNHDSERVMRNMRAFQEKVMPLVDAQ